MEAVQHGVLVVAARNSLLLVAVSSERKKSEGIVIFLIASKASQGSFKRSLTLCACARVNEM